MANGIPRIHHRNALGEQQRCQKIALLLGAKSLNVGIVGRSFNSAIPAAIVVIAVPIAFAINLVVLIVEANQVLHGEAVVSCDEIYTGVWTAAAMSIKITGPCNSIGQISDGSVVSLPVSSHRVAISIIPFSPSDWEVADLIAAFAEVPRFGNQFHLREHRVLMDDV